MKVSVIVPVYNLEAYIEKCLESLVHQTLEDIEIIVINDGSKDNSQKVIEIYEKQYPHKIRAYIKENAGQGVARNLGLQVAKGDYISFVDGDDYLAPNALEEMYKLSEQKCADICICDYMEVYEDGTEKEIKELADGGLKDIKKAYIMAMPGFCNKLFRRAYLEKIKFKFLPIRAYEDFASYAPVGIKAENIAYYSQPAYYYVIRQGSTMQAQKMSKRLLDIFPAEENLRKELQTIENADGLYHEELEYMYITHILHAASLRFLPYKEQKYNLLAIRDIMKENYPNWKENMYFGEREMKYKLMCYLLYHKLYFLVKLLKKK